MNKVSPYLKAVVGFLGAALVAYLGAQDGGVTSAEWIQILLAGLGASGLVYFVPNKAPKTGARGAVDVVLLLVLATFVLVLLLFLGLHGHH